MIPLNPRRVDRANNNTPILSNREIDDYAHTVLADYKPELLQEPGEINYQHFLESYLEMRIYLLDIYSDDPDRPILAMTAFKKGKIKVFDKKNECVKKVIVPARSVIIDNTLTPPDMKHLALFSGMHEGGHITMQWHVYTGETFDGDLFELDDDWDSGIDPIVCCRRDHIESKSLNTRKARTAKEWREHQADYFAAAITMPNATFIPYVNCVMRECGYYRGSIPLGRNEDWDILANDILPDAISDVYGVSRRAAQIKLRTSGFVTGTKRN
jgi:hypothetical protein